MYNMGSFPNDKDNRWNPFPSLFKNHELSPNVHETAAPEQGWSTFDPCPQRFSGMWNLEAELHPSILGGALMSHNHVSSVNFLPWEIYFSCLSSQLSSWLYTFILDSKSSWTQLFFWSFHVTQMVPEELVDTQKPSPFIYSWKSDLEKLAPLLCCVITSISSVPPLLGLKHTTFNALYSFIVFFFFMCVLNE